MNNKQIISVGVVTSIAIVLSIIWWIMSPSWVDLYPVDLSPDEKQVVVGTLSKLEIAYKYDDASKKILIKSEDLARTRKTLADSGVPKKTSTGLELFSNSDYGLSEFVQNINYQRGMEEELARTIRSMNGVKDARVHITIKKASLFEERKQEPKASIILSLKDGVSFDKQQIHGIQKMIATAIPSLSPDAVVIVSESGRVISTSEDSSQVEDINSIETKYLNIVDGLLQEYLGNIKFRASINVAVDRKKKITIEENYFPDQKTGKGFIMKSKQSDKKDDPALQQNNIGIQSIKDEEFIYSKERSEINIPSGSITKVSVGVVIQKYLSIEEQLTLKDLVSKSIGLDATRGDSIILVAAKEFEETNNINSNPNDQGIIISPEKAIPSSKAIDFFNTGVLKNYVIFVLALVLLFILLLFFTAKYFMLRADGNNSLSPSEREKLISDLKNWFE